MFKTKLIKRIENLEKNKAGIKTIGFINECLGNKILENGEYDYTDQIGSLPKLQKKMLALMDHLKLEFKEKSVIKTRYGGGWIGNREEYIEKELEVVPRNEASYISASDFKIIPSTNVKEAVKPIKKSKKK